MNTDTIAPIAVITATPADKFFDPAEPDGFVVALAEVLTAVLDAVVPCVDALWEEVLGVALLPVAVLVVMLVMALFDVRADDPLIAGVELPVDAEAEE
jgi:hypothetical protein